MKRNVPDERLRESVGEALGAVTFTYSRGEGQENDKVRSQAPKLYMKIIQTEQKQKRKRSRKK